MPGFASKLGRLGEAKGVEYRKVEPLLREPGRVHTTGVRRYRHCIFLEQVNCLGYGLDGLTVEEHTCRMAALTKRPDNVAGTSTAEGDQWSAASLGLGKRYPEILASGEHHRTGVRDFFDVFMPRQIAGEDDVGTGKRSQMLGLYFVAYYDQATRRRFAERLDNQIRTLIRRVECGRYVVVVLVGDELKFPGGHGRMVRPAPRS